MTQDNSRFAVHFDLSKKNTICGIILLAASIGLFFIYPEILLETTESGDRIFHQTEALVCASLILTAYLLRIMNFTIPQQVQRIFRWALLLLVPLLCVVTAEWINDSELFHAFNLAKWFGNYLCNLVIFLFFYAVSRRINISLIIPSIISVVFAIANYFTLQFRGSPVLPWDFQSLSTAMGVAGGYEYKVTYPMVCTVFILLVLFVFASKITTNHKNDSKKFSLIERLVSFSCSAILLVALLPMNLLGNMGIDVWPWNQKASMSMMGVSANFFGNLQFVLVEKPENYSKKAVENLYEELSSNSNPSVNTPKKSLPTVIAIMNESFTDMSTTSKGNISLNKDNMPFIHSLMESENVISGTAYSSVFGGNTCDSEFEFLTGNSMSFLPVGSKPFQQYIDTDQTSLVSTLNQNDYKSIAIHPGVETAWNRDVAYPYLGFSDYIYNTAFSTNRTFLRKLTDDASCYREVIHRYEDHKSTSDDPLFIWNVTIQNHGGFENKDYKKTISIDEHEGEFPRAEEYLSLIGDSDQDFKYLYDYFSQQDEPVIIIMFGDHWPNLEAEFTELLLGVDDLNEIALEDSMRQYEVPYFIWANYPLEIPDQDFSITSINYLSSLLLSSAGLELTSYNSFMLDLHKTLPVINSLGIIDHKGNYYKTDAPSPYQDLLNDYAVLQYNQLFDNKEKIDDVFTLKAHATLP